MRAPQHLPVIIARTGGTMKVVQQNGIAATDEWETGEGRCDIRGHKSGMPMRVRGSKSIEVKLVKVKKAN